MVEDSGNIPHNQFGFRERHSTTEQTHQIVHDMNEATDNNTVLQHS
jgi:hypothetical protein